MLNLDVPFHFDCRGHTAGTSDDDHVRDMIEAVLFTNLGERVNRPDFGSGLLQLVFAPNSPELAASVRVTVMGALQRWLGDVIEVRDLAVTSQDATLEVALQYVVRATGAVQTATFQRGVA
jgi:Bacteriophage baseplate protein W